MFSAEGLAQLAKWGLTAQDAEQAGLFEADDASTIYPDFDAQPALIIPYFQVDGEPMSFTRDGEELAFCRLRYLNPPQQSGFTVKKAQRYSQPGKSGTRCYFGPGLEWQRMSADIQEPVIITEGEAKALCGIKHGFPVIALGGVYNFTNGGDELMPELEAWKWRGRDVYVCFDSDALTNPNVLAAEARLVDELQRKRGARCFLIRLPAEGDSKTGLDDFLQLYGTDAFAALLSTAPYLGALDAKVVSMNKTCAWIEAEGLVWDMEEKQFIKKGDFTVGSRFSALKHITLGGKQRSQPKEVSVATTWLTHPHAQRYGQILFRPGEGAVVETEHGRPALNMWTGWEGERNDKLIEPFLQLNEYLFQNLPEQHRDLPLKLMAYKAQNPQRKVPLALVLIGPQGCGKSLWGECMKAAFAPYSKAVKSKHFDGQFQGWMEQSLFAVVNEAEAQHVQKYGEVLKSLISDLDQMMDEKYRPARMIKSYTMYMLTANSRAVGTYANDDRRMIVVDCPKPKTGWPVYEYLGIERGAWHPAGGPAALRWWLQHYDLKGWKPPARAPMTAEKHLAYVEGLTSVQALAEDMKNSSEHTIKLWLDQAAAWAEMTLVGGNAMLHPAANATLDGINQLQVRPWYEPRELALIFPNLCASLLGSRYDKATPPGKLSRELRESGVPYLVCSDDPMGFTWRGAKRQFLVVTDFEEWREPLSQADFERLMNNWPTYAALRARRAK